MKASEKLMLVSVAVALAIAAVLIAIRAVIVVEDVHEKHPEWGFFEWMLAGAWVASAFLVGRFVRRLCERKKWSADPVREGWAGSVLYVYLSAIVAVVVSAV